jgi:hypothetical protein
MDDQPLIIRTLSSVLFPGFAGAFYFYGENIAVGKILTQEILAEIKKNRPVAGFFLLTLRSLK